tara:strand:+ start:16477 stop:17313 length:837 start_codon:yes stop_codon:yes gene_type:complete
MIIIKCLILLFFNVESYILPNIYYSINKKNRINNPIILLDLQTDINETHNSSFDNVKSIEYNEEQDLWILDLELPSPELPSPELSTPELLESGENDNFPSFNDFLKNRKKKEPDLDNQYVDYPDQNTNHAMQSKHLNMLTRYETIDLSKQWIYDMIHNGSSINYPKFLYDNIYDMREFCSSNTDRMCFCIGYSPPGSIYGPYYIGLFKLNTINKELHVHLIMQNPNYFIMDNEKNIFNNYKKELIYIARKSDISFRYNRLKNIPQCERYYLDWFYNDL